MLGSKYEIRDKQRNAVDESQVLFMHTVPPITKSGFVSIDPNPDPKTDTTAVPAIGRYVRPSGAVPLAVDSPVIIGALYEKAAERVLLLPPTVTATSQPIPVPTGSLHTIKESDVQVLDSHPVSPIRILTDVS